MRRACFYSVSQGTTHYLSALVLFMTYLYFSFWLPPLYGYGLLGMASFALRPRHVYGVLMFIASGLMMFSECPSVLYSTPLYIYMASFSICTPPVDAPPRYTWPPSLHSLLVFVSFTFIVSSSACPPSSVWPDYLYNLPVRFAIFCLLTYRSDFEALDFLMTGGASLDTERAPGVALADLCPLWDQPM